MPRPTAPPAGRHRRNPSRRRRLPQPPPCRQIRAPPAQPQQPAGKPRRCGKTTHGRSRRAAQSQLTAQRRAAPGSSSLRCAARKRRARNGTVSGARIPTCSEASRRRPIRADLGDKGMLLPPPDRPPIADADADLRRAEAAQHRVHHCPITLPRRGVSWAAPANVLPPSERDFFAAADPVGFILFRRNCRSPDQVRDLVAALRDCVGPRRRAGSDRSGRRPGGTASAAALAPLPVGRAPRPRCRTRGSSERPASARG